MLSYCCGLFPSLEQRPLAQRANRQQESFPGHHLCSLLPTGKSKKEDSAKEEKRKRDVPAQLLKSAKPTPGSKSQQVPQGQQPSAPQAQQGGFSGHKEIKLTLLNKVTFPAGWHSLLAGIPCSQGQQGGMDPGGRGAPGSALLG